MKTYKNNDLLNKLVLGLMLTSAFMLIFNNYQLSAANNETIQGIPTITNANKYCGSGGNSPTKMVTENDVCSFTHKLNFKRASNRTEPISVPEYKVWRHNNGVKYISENSAEGQSNIFSISNLTIKKSGSTWQNPSYSKTLNYKGATSNVMISQKAKAKETTATTAPTYSNYTKFNMVLQITYPKCTTIIDNRTSNYYANGTYYIQGTTGTIAWSVSGAECSANGGSSCDEAKNIGQVTNVAVQSVSDKINSNGIIPKGTTTNLYNWNLFGYKSACTTKYAYCFDGKAPTCKLSLSTTAWTNGNVSVTRTCNDSGCAGCSSSNGVVGTHSTNGQKGGYACKDKAGNDAGLKYITISNIDKLAPKCGTVSAVNGNYYYNTAYQINVPCSDQAATSDYGKSGCKKDNYTASTSNGSYSVTIYDVAGNSTTCTGTKNLTDTSKPTVTITLENGHEGYNSNTHYTSNATVKATISAVDSGNAGINKVCYTLSGSTSKAETCVNGSSTTVTISNNGNTTITAYAYDNAYDYNSGSPRWNGNKSDSKTRVVYIDRTAPTVNFTTTPSTQWSNVAPTATFTASDNAAGLYTVQTVWAPTNDSSTAFSTYASSVKTHSIAGNAFSSTASNNASISGNIYLHIKVCDNAFSTFNTHKPNCTTKMQGPFKFDITNESTIEATLGGVTANSVDWTHVLKDLTFKATNDTLGNGRSGLGTINLYFDNNYPHTNTNISNAKFNTNPNVSKTCSTDKTKETPTACSYAIDFASLKSDPVKSGEGGAVTEGVRYIKVEVVDLAGNKKAKVFGPYKWDTTKSKFESNLTPSGTPGKFYQE